MKLAFVLHFYQPPFQDEVVFKQIVATCYLPLIKLIKKHTSTKFTINIPLSTLEQLDNYGYNALIKDLKDLWSAERIEITGSAAYHPLLTKLSYNYLDKQLILNEYGLGYYLGSHQGFEGEAALVLKNVVGFFPPELAVNADILPIISDFGYDWLLVDAPSIPPTSDLQPTAFDTGGFYKVADSDLIIVCRDRALSNLLAFKRTVELTDIVTYFSAIPASKEYLIVALDAETFGHHYNEGIFMLEALLDLLNTSNVVLETVSGIIEGDIIVHPISHLVEATWGCSDADVASGNLYPYWFSPDNKPQVLLWKLQSLISDIPFAPEAITSLVLTETSPLWKIKEDASLQAQIDVLRLLGSDKFWWLSNKFLPDGTKLYNIQFVLKYLTHANALIAFCTDEKLKVQLTATVKEFKERVVPNK